MIYGVDTSYANGIPNWRRAFADDRVKFVYARASYGANPADNDGASFAITHDACKAASVPFLPYTFWLYGQPAADQVANYLTAADGRFGLSTIVDVEEGSGALGWGSIGENVLALAATLDLLQVHVGQSIIYTNSDTWTTYFGGTDAFAGHRFAVAHYGVRPGAFGLIPGIVEVVIHQFSDGSGLAPIPGLSTPDNNGDRDVLIAPNFAALARR